MGRRGRGAVADGGRRARPVHDRDFARGGGAWPESRRGRAPAPRRGGSETGSGRDSPWYDLEREPAVAPRGGSGWPDRDRGAPFRRAVSVSTLSAAAAGGGRFEDAASRRHRTCCFGALGRIRTGRGGLLDF